MSEVCNEKVGSETGTNTIFRFVGQSIGVTITGAMMATYVGRDDLPTDKAYKTIEYIGLAMGLIALMRARWFPMLAPPKKIERGGG